MMKKLLALLTVIFVLSGCVTTSGNYVVSATRTDGSPLNTKMTAQGSGIYTVRNAICASNPKATVFIHDAKTGQELQSESPYKCK